MWKLVRCCAALLSVFAVGLIGMPSAAAGFNPCAGTGTGTCAYATYYNPNNGAEWAQFGIMKLGSQRQAILNWQTVNPHDFVSIVLYLKQCNASGCGVIASTSWSGSSWLSFVVDGNYAFGHTYYSCGSFKDNSTGWVSTLNVCSPAIVN